MNEELKMAVLKGLSAELERQNAVALFSYPNAIVGGVPIDLEKLAEAALTARKRWHRRTAK